MKRKLEAIFLSSPELKFIWQSLVEEAPETFLVGGGVRNLLLGLPLKDFDLATSLTPNEIIALADRKGWYANLAGASFGVVLVRLGKIQVEVATFRKEGYDEKDPHRPSWVEYGASLYEDLGRRDFTMNGMALSLKGELIDPFGGQGDIEKKLIRAIGVPEHRFQEDYLRMLRAVRFASEYSFDLEEKTAQAILGGAKHVIRLSAERITQELDRIFQSSSPEKGWLLLEQLDLGRYLFPDSWKVRRQDICWSRISRKPLFRWAYLGILLSEKEVNRKGMHRHFIQAVKWLIRTWDLPWEGMATLRLLKKNSFFKNKSDFYQGVQDWLSFRRDLGFSLPESEVLSYLSAPFFSNELALSGEEIGKISSSGLKTGENIEMLLESIQDGKVANDPEKLRRYLKKQ